MLTFSPRIFALSTYSTCFICVWVQHMPYTQPMQQLKKRVLLLFPGRNSSFVRNACHTCNIHNSCTQLGSIPTPLDLVDEKMTCVGSWETACVDRNWAGGGGGGGAGHASRVTIWPTCVTTATQLFRIFGIFETLGSGIQHTIVRSRCRDSHLVLSEI